MSKNSKEEFRQALNNACGEINEAARLSGEIFADEELEQVRGDLASLMSAIDFKLLSCLPRA